MITAGYGFDVISKFLGVSKTTISKIKNDIKLGNSVESKKERLKDQFRDEIESLRLLFPNDSGQRIAELASKNKGKPKSRVSVN